MKIILREGCFMGPYVRLHFLILYLFPSKEWLREFNKQVQIY